MFMWVPQLAWLGKIAHTLHQGLVFGCGRAQESRYIVRVGQRDTALAAAHRFDLVGVAALGAARHIAHQVFEPNLGGGCPLMLDHGAEQ
jgi:hypothetical protein